MILEADFSSVSEYLQVLSQLSAAAPDEDLWFRGHSDVSYKLLPSLAREGGVDKESLLTKRFRQNAYPYRLTPPQSEWEWLFLMQHYGVPTRLLDWTESPLVALFFAVSNSSKDDTDGVIWSLLPAKYNFNVPRIRPANPVDIPCFGVEALLNDYMPDQMRLETMSVKHPIAAIANRQNERIVAQLGVFTVMHRDQTPLEDLAKDYLAKFRIPAGAKAQLRSELAALRITKMSLFPELASVAEATKGLLK